jgi:large conductance mechanosensitive channel
MSKRIVKKIASTHIGGFMQFVREQGVVGLATGFLLGGAVSKVVTALVTDIINPMISIVFGSAEGFKMAAIQVGDSQIMWGDFASVLIDFIIVAAVVYFGFKGLGLDKLDKKKEKVEEKKVETEKEKKNK